MTWAVLPEEASFSDNSNSNNNNVRLLIGQVGVQAEEGEEETTHPASSHKKGGVQECPVIVRGNLSEILQAEKVQQESSEEESNKATTTMVPRYRDKVQVFDFHDFSVTVSRGEFSDHDDDDNNNDDDASPPSHVATVSLRQVMEHLKPKIEADNNADDSALLKDEENDNKYYQNNNCGADDDDDDWGTEEEDEQESALLRLHDVFLPIVRQILRDHAFFASALGDWDDNNNSIIRIQKYARPNYRSATSHYAMYLHNDAWFTDDTSEDDDTQHEEEEEREVTVGMVNIWFVLNDAPPSNTLVFWETAVSQTRPSHMLHARPAATRHKVVAYDCHMAWGRFYIFVAGQRPKRYVDDDGKNNHNNVSCCTEL